MEKGDDERRVLAPRAGRVRGLRDIRTLGSLRMPVPSGPAIPCIGVHGVRLGFGTARREPRGDSGVSPERPKTWVFLQRPRFSRHQRRLLVDRVAEPDVDVFEEEQAVLVLAELPGARDGEVEVQVNGDVLTLSTRPTRPDGLRQYREILLPFPVSPRIARQTLHNGVLELELLRASPPAGSGREES
jgi:HSP20 family molecular chaperone IbpA